MDPAAVDQPDGGLRYLDAVAGIIDRRREAVAVLDLIADDVDIVVRHARVGEAANQYPGIAAGIGAAVSNRRLAGAIADDVLGNGNAIEAGSSGPAAYQNAADAVAADRAIADADIAQLRIAARRVGEENAIAGVRRAAGPREDQAVNRDIAQVCAGKPYRVGRTDRGLAGRVGTIGDARLPRSDRPAERLAALEQDSIARREREAIDLA